MKSFQMIYVVTNETDSFYDTFPEIEVDVRAFVVQVCF